MTEPFSILHMKNDITKLPDEEAMNYNWKKKRKIILQVQWGANKTFHIFLGFYAICQLSKFINYYFLTSNDFNFGLNDVFIFFLKLFF